jgi:hypothetical protein
MRVILEAITGPHIKKRIVMPGYQKGTFGRTEWADYQFPDDTLMSSQHFSIECVGTTCVVRDLDSTNGTYVNDERVVEGTLVTGSIIRAGQTRVKVTLEEGVAPTRPAVAPAPTAPPPKKVAAEPDLRPLRAAPRVPERAVVRDEKKIAPNAHQKALDDADPLVQRAALLAAAWTGRRWVLEHCRSQSAAPAPENWEALLLLAILGEPADLARIVAVGRAAELGPRRFQILGAFGHPEVMNDLIVGIESGDPAIAVAAGRAFTKITGVDISSEAEPASASAEGRAEETEQAALEGVALPSAEKAVREWRKLKGKFSGGQRWLGGLDASRGLPADAADKLDLESRFEACLRGRFQGTWKASRFDLAQLADKLATSKEEIA